MKRLISHAVSALILLGGCSRPPAQNPQPDSGVSEQRLAFMPVPRFTLLEGTTPLDTQTVKPAAQTADCNPGPQKVLGNTTSVDLRLRRVSATINNPSEPDHPTDQLALRTYSGCLTSPAIDVTPGTSLQIHLYNDLDTNDPTCNNPAGAYLKLAPGVGCFNTTNLHTHGLHVSPGSPGKADGDNVLLSIAPGTREDYQIDIPPDHPAGTFWYHAHMHGSTAVGVASANAGALIVHGNRKTDIDTILHGADGAKFPDTVFMLQQLGYGCFWTTDPASPYDYLITKTGLFKTDGTVIPNEGKKEADVGDAKVGPIAEWACHPSDQEQNWWRTKTGNGTVTPGVVENFNTQLFSAKVWDVNGRFTSINGVVQPTLTVPAGQIERWRFVHGGIHDTINLQIVKMTPLPANGPTGPLSGALANRTVKEQAPFVNQVCKAAPDTLIPQFEIAADGLTRTHIYKVGTTGTGGGAIPGTSSVNYLQPGYRSDVLVVFPSEGDYCLLDQAAPDSARVKNGGGGGQGPDSPRLLAYVHVRGGRAVPGDLEQHLKQTLYDSNSALSPAERNGLLAGNLTPWAPFTELAPPGEHVQPHVYFEIGKAGFTVNGETYQPDKVQPLLIRQVGTTDDWKVRVDPVDPKGGAAPHIFHIHINPFEIIDVRQLHVDAKGQVTGTGESIFDANGKCLPKFEALAGNYCGQYHVFRDTLFIQNGFEATLRTHYADYTGEFVLHCHILDHEDAGMMANVMIVQDRAHPPKPAPRHMPAAHRMPAPH